MRRAARHPLRTGNGASPGGPCPRRLRAPGPSCRRAGRSTSSAGPGAPRPTRGPGELEDRRGAGPDRPRAARSFHGKGNRRRGPPSAAGFPEAPSASRGSARPRRTSSRGTRSESRSPRSARRRGTLFGGGTLRREAPRVRRRLERPRGPRRAGVSGAGDASSDSDSISGSQYCRRTAPMGVPGPTRVNRALSSGVTVWPDSTGNQAASVAAAAAERQLLGRRPVEAF